MSSASSTCPYIRVGMERTTGIRDIERSDRRESRMCGRVHCTLNAAQVARACGLQDGDADSVRTVEMDRFRPSYNVSPGTYLPVFTVRRDVQGSQAGNPCDAIHCMKWGLVPSFTKKSEKPDYYRMPKTNQELELTEIRRRGKGRNKEEIQKIKKEEGNKEMKEEAEGEREEGEERRKEERFYEWKKDGSKKLPYYIHFKDGRPLVFAALYDSWENLEGEIFHTFTILTTRSSSALEWLHDRMPVIIGSKDTIDMWLSNPPLKLEAVLTPYTDFDLVWYPVTSAMGKPSFEGPECIKELPLKLTVQNQISKLFSRKTDDNINKCKAEPEFINPSDVFSKNENPNSLEEPAMEDTKELADEERHKSDDDFPSAQKRTVGSEELHGIKRELEEMGPEFEVKTELPDSYSTSMKKKLKTGDRQSLLLSYFGRK